MTKVPIELHNSKKNVIKGLQEERLAWWQHWRELADFYLPRRYRWLLSGREARKRREKNPFILDSTGTSSARTLSSGMMNGITSPSRPWFRLRIPALEETDVAANIWLEEVRRIMLLIMAESNFYTCMAVMYLDLVVFGTAAMLIFEDFEDVISCYNPPCGEYYLAQSSRYKVNTVVREFTYQVHQVVDEFGIENCSERVKSSFRAGGSRLFEDVDIFHLIEPNDARDGRLSSRFNFREYYWEKAGILGEMLGIRGYIEFPGLFPRWETTGNDAYGNSPAMDALGDVIQLQHETKKKAQSLDKMVSPPVVADIQLQHKPLALLPNGVTYVAGASQIGVKPIDTVNPPLDAMTADMRDVQARIRETFHNDLFRMISQLDTVRSATEIDARREEKLVLLGPVLERFESEALDPAIKRIFAISERAGLFPDAPPSIANQDLEIQYVGILSSAQSAVGTAAIERWLQLIGEVSAGMYPKAVNVPDFDEILRDYARDIGVAAKHVKTQEEIDQDNKRADELAQAREDAATGTALVQAGKTLSETDVGGGSNALQQLLAQ